MTLINSTCATSSTIFTRLLYRTAEAIGKRCDLLLNHQLQD
jgi:hypothetical protein